MLKVPNTAYMNRGAIAMKKIIHLPRHSRVWVLSILLTAAAAFADSAPPEPLSAFPQSLLAIRTNNGSVINFKIWDADTPRRQEQGLMFVRAIDEHAGMLFVFPASQIQSMWMKNTYLPLDLLFIDDKGRIDTIAARAKPLVLDIISAPTPARAVLELNGGACERLGIKVGDQIIHSRLGNR